MVVVATFEYLDAETQSALVDFARAGGTLVIGPELPQLDSTMLPCTTLADAARGAMAVTGGQRAQIGGGQVIVVSDLAQVPRAIGTALDDASVSRITKSDVNLDVVLHRDQTDPSRRVAFVCNPTDAEVSARIGLGAEIVAASGLWTDSAVSVKEGELALDLPPYSITVADLTVRA